MEQFLASIGLGSELARFMAFGGLAAVLEFVFKPSVMFLGDGSARPWMKPWSSDNPADATYLPWWLAAAIIGLAGALFL